MAKYWPLGNFEKETRLEVLRREVLSIDLIAKPDLQFYFLTRK